MIEMWDPDSGFRHTSGHDEILDPLHWRKPRLVLVCPENGLFDEGNSFHLIDKIMAVMVISPEHRFYVQVKNPARMREYFNCYPSIVDEGNIHDQLCSNPDILWEASKLFGGEPVRYCDLVGVDERYASSAFTVELDSYPDLPPANVTFVSEISFEARL